MSTRLLSTPGKIHELCDDLESLWFVLLFEGLHFVEHSKPSGIKMAFIFDHVDVSSTTGTHTGGSGKMDLYSHKGSVIEKGLVFNSKPFTTLVRQIYGLFEALNTYYAAQDRNKAVDESVKEMVGKLESCAEIERLLEAALKSGQWPKDCDKVEDQYPPLGRSTPQQKETVALTYVDRHLEPSVGPSGVKRRREEKEKEENEAQVQENKRPKTRLSKLTR